MPTTDSRVAYRRGAGLVAGAAGLLLIASSFLAWITTPMQTGGRTSISGWGLISGGSDEANGVNFNDLMSGVGSYRPGAVALIAGAVALIPALIVAVTGPGRRPSRIVAVVLAACGAVARGVGDRQDHRPGGRPRRAAWRSCVRGGGSVPCGVRRTGAAGGGRRRVRRLPGSGGVAQQLRVRPVGSLTGRPDSGLTQGRRAPSDPTVCAGPPSGPTRPAWTSRRRLRPAAPTRLGCPIRARQRAGVGSGSSSGR